MKRTDFYEKYFRNLSPSTFSVKQVDDEIVIGNIMKHKVKKANAGAYLAIAQQAKDIAPESVGALDKRIASKLSGPKYTDEKLFAEKGAKISAKWVKYSKSELKKHNEEFGDVTLYDVWYDPNDGEKFYKIERIDGEDEYFVMGELGDLGEELIEEYSTLAEARARCKELVSNAEKRQMKQGGKTDNWIGSAVDEMEEKGTVGAFTKKAKKAGMSTVQFAKEVLSKKNEKKFDLKTRRQAQFMKNVNPQMFEKGGKVVKEIGETMIVREPFEAEMIDDDGEIVDMTLAPGDSVKVTDVLDPFWVVNDGDNDYRLEHDDTKYFEKGGTIIDEDGSNLPEDLYELFGEQNEDNDPYHEMERLRLKANEIGYDFDYDLSGSPTEFWSIKMSNGGRIYEFSYRDEEGDEYEEQFDSLKEAKETMKEYRKQGYDIIETWIYDGDNFKGRFEYGGFIESMGPTYNDGIESIEDAFRDWINGPMTTGDMVGPAIDDVVNDLYDKLKRISNRTDVKRSDDDVSKRDVIQNLDIYSLDGRGSKTEDLTQTIATINEVLNKEAMKLRVEVEDMSGSWLVTSREKKYADIGLYATPFWNDEPETLIVWAGDDVGIGGARVDLETDVRMTTYTDLLIYFVTRVAPEIRRVILKQSK